MKKQYSISIVVVSLMAVFLIGLQLAGGFWPLRVLNDQIANPIGSWFVSVGKTAAEGLAIISKVGELAKQNKQLESEVLELKKQLSILKEIANENQILRSQLQFNERLNLDLVPARVVASDGTIFRKFITIDRGASSGISKGMAVVSSGVLIGVIDKVEQFSSTVFLATDPESGIRAISQDGRAQGIVRGQLGQGYLFDKIDQTEVISVGESVITAGSGLIPKGILIGEVESIQKSDNAVFQTAFLRPLVDTNNLEIVFVVTGLKQ